MALNNISIAYFRKGDFSNAFEFATKALKWNDSIQYLPQIAIAYKNIGIVYHSQFNYKLAIVYLTKALNLQNKLGNKIEVGRALNNIAATAIEDHNLPIAKAYISRALLHNKQLKDYYQLALSYRNAGGIAEYEQKKDSAFYYFNLALFAAEKGNSAFLQETVLLRIGQLYLRNKQFDKAIQFLNNALTLSISLDAKNETALIHHLKAQALEGQGNYKIALFEQRESGRLKEELNEEKKRNKLAAMQAEFGSDRKQIEINSLQLERIKSEKKEMLQTSLNISLAISAFIIGIMLFIIWRKNKIILGINKQLTTQKQALEEMLLLKDKIFSIISHDLRGPIASLGAVLPMLDPNSIDYTSYAALKNNLSKQVQSLNLTLENLLVWARNQMKGPSIPDKKPVHLHQLVDRNIDILLSMADQKKIQFTNAVPENCIAFLDLQHMDIILRNLLLNALKFTFENGFIIVKAVEEENNIILTITDNGIGMTKEQLGKLFQLKTHFTSQGTKNEKGTGLGLLICSEYASANNCLLKVESEKGEGTIISLILPKVPL